MCALMAPTPLQRGSGASASCGHAEAEQLPPRKHAGPSRAGASAALVYHDSATTLVVGLV